MEMTEAQARVYGDSVRGCVTLRQTGQGVWVSVEIRGLPGDGFFALHIHEGGSCGGESFADTAGHYNPSGAEHPNHAGDLPPLLSCGGRAQMQVLTDRFRVEEILGRTVVIHANADDFHTQPAGDAGKKIACGVIRPKSCLFGK